MRGTGWLLHMVLGINQFQNIQNLFNNWYPLRNKTFISFLLTGVAAIYWSIWLTSNEVVFDKCRQKTLLRVLFREHTDFGFRLSCSGVWTRGNKCWRQAASWTMWLCISSCPSDGPLFQEFSFESVLWVQSLRWLVCKKLVWFLSLGYDAGFFPLSKKIWLFYLTCCWRKERPHTR